MRFLQGWAAMLPVLFDSLHPAARKTQLRQHLRLPPFAKCAKDGAPHSLQMLASLKAWATRQSCETTQRYGLAPPPGESVIPERVARLRYGRGVGRALFDVCSLDLQHTSVTFRLIVTRLYQEGSHDQERQSPLHRKAWF